MTTITKKDFIKALTEELKEKEDLRVTQKDLNTVITTMIEMITNAVANGDAVKFPEFVTFTSQEVAARTARNPRTGESVDVPAHNRVKVKISKVFKEKVQ